MKSKLSLKIVDNTSVFDLVLSLFVVNFILIGLAIFFYNGHFQIWQYPFSFSGQVRTEDGLVNLLSSRIYATDMFVSGLIMAKVAVILYKKASPPEQIFRTLIAAVCAGGFLIASFNPNDTKHAFHVLGSALIVASVWIMTTNYLYEVKEKMKPWQYYGLQALLQLPIFAYAATYFLNLDPISSILQKFALASLCILFLYTLKKSE